MRRRLLIAVGALLLSGVVAAVAWMLLPPTPGVTLKNFRRLQPGWDDGMTEADVQRLFGGPGTPNFRVTGSYFRRWKSDDVEIELTFSEMLGEDVNGEWSGRLEFGYFKNAATGFTEKLEGPLWHPPEETMVQRFRRWLGI